MVTHEIALTFTLSPRRVRLLLAVGLCVLLPRLSSTADVSTMDLFYPPPSAVYSQLKVTGNVTLARDYGSVLVGAFNNPNGYLVVGGSLFPDPGFPGTHLRVIGTMNVDGCLNLYNGISSANLGTIWRCRFTN